MFGPANVPFQEKDDDRPRNKGGRPFLLITVVKDEDEIKFSCKKEEERKKFQEAKNETRSKT